MKLCPICKYPLEECQCEQEEEVWNDEVEEW